MNVYELVAGPIRHFVAAVDEDDAYKQGTDPETFPDIHFRPFEIRKVEVDGYTITVTANVQDEAETVKNKGGRPRKQAAE